MARPREFILEEALEDAMQVFWSKGYEGASLPDLLDAMSITRGSLYKAYGDKKSLFLQALALYDKQVITPAIERLRTQSTDPETSRIRQLFSSVIQEAKRGDRRGCLLCNTAATSASEDQDIKRAVTSMLARLARAFSFALQQENAQASSQASRKRQDGQTLTAAYIGLRILARSGASVSVMEHAVAGLLD